VELDVPLPSVIEPIGIVALAPLAQLMFKVAPSPGTVAFVDRRQLLTTLVVTLRVAVAEPAAVEVSCNATRIAKAKMN
jgi:hypothetical protein